jgi:hypothetical protein
MALLVLIWLAVWQTAKPAAAFPHPDEFARNLRRALQLDYQIQKEFTYIERRRDVKISSLGKVTIGPLRTFQVYPHQSGRTYKRLIEIDGRPLTPEELARRDAEHERNLREAAEREQRETPEQRAARHERIAKEQRDRDAVLNDAFAVFEATFSGRESIDGQQVLIADLKPRPDARVTTREGRWMKNFAGRLWVDERDYQIVKLDMRAVSDVTIGWGVIGRIHAGSRVLFARRRFENAWLPSETTYEASGRTLLFRPFQFSVTASYSNYKRHVKSVAN